MKDQDNNWTSRAKRLVWDKAPFIDVRHPEYGKKDPCKACIKEEEYGNQNSDYGWQIDHIYPEQKLQDAGVPQELIDHIDNLRPMHWKNNNKKSDDFPVYAADITAIGVSNLDVPRDYRINIDQINVLRNLYREYNVDITYPTVLGRWQAMIDRELVPTDRIPAIFYDEIHTESIHDLD